jgi:hypothetical protein
VGVRYGFADDVDDVMSDFTASSVNSISDPRRLADIAAWLRQAL